MLVITHALVGGFLASKITPPPLSYSLIIIFHFLSDRLPHWDEGAVFSKKQKKKLLIYGFLDSLLAISLVWLIFQKRLPLKPWLWGGVFISVLPDLLGLPVLILNWHPWLLEKIELFHSHLMHRKTNQILRGLLPQLIIIVLILIFC